MGEWWWWWLGGWWRGKGWGGAELEGLALAEVPRLRHAGLGEHVRLIYVMPGPVADPGLDSTCPPSNQPPHPLPTPTLSLFTIPFGLSGRQVLEEEQGQQEEGLRGRR